MTSAGELLLGRPLERERVAGVEHYKPGQLAAVIYPRLDYEGTGEKCDLARITYVDRMGHACVVLALRRGGGEWEPTWIGRAGQLSAENPRRAPASFALTESMLAALAVAPHEDLASTHERRAREPEAVSPIERAERSDA